MTRDVKYLVLALAMATAGAVAPPTLRGVKDASGAAETVGDTFEMSLAKAVAKNEATLAVETTPKLRGAAEKDAAHRRVGRGLDFGYRARECPELGVPDECPGDATGLRRCDEVLSAAPPLEVYCVGDASTCSDHVYRSSLRHAIVKCEVCAGPDMPASDCLAHFGGDGGRRRLDESPAPTTAPLYVFEVRQPTPAPTPAEPTAKPTGEPTHKPTAAPAAAPAVEPTAAPTAKPTAEPTAGPTGQPTASTPGPMPAPMPLPTPAPTPRPTPASSGPGPTAVPTAAPTAAPTPVCVYPEDQRRLLESGSDERRGGRAEFRQAPDYSRIINGGPAIQGNQPWMVALIRAGGGGYNDRHYCGGTLIRHSWVLTAAHCIVTPHSTKSFPTTVVVGAFDLTDWQNEGDTEIMAPEERVVDDVLIHEKYYENPIYPGPPAYRAGAYDVALLHLKEPIFLLETVAIAQNAPSVGTPVEVMGWGNTNDRANGNQPADYPPELQIVELCVLNDPKCSAFPKFTADFEICIGDTPEKQNIGSADSGGPAMLDGEQVGIISRKIFADDLASYRYRAAYGDAVALKPWMDAQIDSWELTLATNCGICESSLNKTSPNSGTINSADECWLDCLRTYVNDDLDDETLWAIDWYPDSKKCKCQSSCDTHETVDDPVVVIVRENYFFPEDCLPTPMPTPRPTPAPTPRPTPPATTTP